MSFKTIKVREQSYQGSCAKLPRNLCKITKDHVQNYQGPCAKLPRSSCKITKVLVQNYEGPCAKLPRTMCKITKVQNEANANSPHQSAKDPYYMNCMYVIA